MKLIHTLLLTVTLGLTLATGCGGALPTTPTPDLAAEIATVKAGVEATATAIAQAAEATWAAMPTWTPRPTRTPTATPGPPTVTPTPTTLTLVAVQDTVLVASLPDEPRGGVSFMRMGSDALILGVQRALVQFSLSALPGGAVVNSATLKLFLNGSSQPAQSMGMTSYHVTRAWTEGDATWDSMADAFAEAYGSVTVFAGENQKFVLLDVTGLVQAWADGTQSNHGIMLRGAEESETNWKQFGTRELGSGFEPQLVIRYSPALSRQ